LTTTYSDTLIQIVDPQEALWLETIVAQPDFKYRIKFNDSAIGEWSMYMIFQMLNGCGYMDGESMYLYQDKEAKGTKQEVYVTNLANLTKMRLLGRSADLKQYQNITVIEERQ
jgi:hypothetical protein